MRSIVSLVLLTALTICLSPGAAFAFDEYNDDYEPPDCIADWDPFCPTGGGSGAGDPEDCYVCEEGYLVGLGNAQVCVSAPQNTTGRAVCDNGLLFSYCDLSGAFCENITVTP